MALFNNPVIRSSVTRIFFNGLRNSIGIQLTGINSNNTNRSYGSIVSTTMHFTAENDGESDGTKENLSKAAKAYLQRAQKYDDMMTEARAEYRVGMRHLANMMGEDPEIFTQADANHAVEYLFPSGLYDKKARPFLKPPEEVFPARKAPQFDKTGRPLHYLFYTASPHFYALCHEAVALMKELDIFEDLQIRGQNGPNVDLQLDTSGSNWLTKDQLQDLIVEDVNERQYFEYIKVFDRLLAHPYSYRVKDFIMKNRNLLAIQRQQLSIVTPKIGEDGRSYVTTYECARKAARGDVTVISPGTGKISINGKNILYFKDKQSREQVSA